MQTIKLDVDKLIRDLSQSKSKNIKKKVPSRTSSSVATSYVGLSEKFRLLTTRNKKETIAVYRSEINRFIAFLKGKQTPDEWDLRRYFDHLERKGLSRSYQRNTWYALKIYFKAKGLEWPLSKRDYPELDKSAIKKPTLSRDQIARMIETTKLYGEPEEKAFLALGSTYANRKSEFCILTEKDIDRKSHTLFIHTVKRGESRHHIIPEQIRPYIYPWNFNTEVTSFRAHSIFNAILEKAGIAKTNGLGTHALRRGVFTILCSTDLPVMRIRNFGRWKNIQEVGMLAEYDNPDFRETDQLVFSRHPLILLWE